MFDPIFENKNIHWLQKLEILEAKEKSIEVFVLRLDLIDVITGGNKYFKLKYNIAFAHNQGYSKILSFGGAYSNHLAAFAKFGQLSGIQTIGVVRGEELNPNSNVTLAEAEKNGMQFLFVSREQFRNKNSSEFLKLLEDRFGTFFLVPEGGSNALAVKGCTEIGLFLKELKFSNPLKYVICPVGTGGTIAGISLGLNAECEAIGIPVLKNAFFLEQEITDLQLSFLQDNSQFALKKPKLLYDYHFGGYAAQTTELKDFIEQFYSQHQIPLDPIYNGKSFYAFIDLLKKDYFQHHTAIVMLHTGGMQSFN